MSSNPSPPVIPKNVTITHEHISAVHRYIVTEALNPFSIENQAKVRAYRLLFHDFFDRNIEYHAIASINETQEIRDFIMSTARSCGLLKTFSFTIRYEGCIGNQRETFDVVASKLASLGGECGGVFRMVLPPAPPPPRKAVPPSPTRKMPPKPQPKTFSDSDDDSDSWTSAVRPESPHSSSEENVIEKAKCCDRDCNGCPSCTYFD